MSSAVLKLGVLVPITSRAAGIHEDATANNSNQPSASRDASRRADAKRALDSVLKGLCTLAASLVGNGSNSVPSLDLSAGNTCNTCAGSSLPSIMVLLGIDADDALLLCHTHDCLAPFTAAGVPAEVLELADHEPGALCQIWADMAGVAVQDHGCNLAVLLGGDPYLASLYRRWKGAVKMLPGVTVHNKVGGVQRIDHPYMPPRYTRHSISKQSMLEELKLATEKLGRWRRDSGTHSPGNTSLIDNGTSITADGVCRPGPALMQEGLLAKSAIAASAMSPAGSDMLESLDSSSNGSTMKSPAAGLAIVGSSSTSCDSVAAEDAIVSTRMSSELVLGNKTAMLDRQLAVDVLVPSYRVDLKYLKGIADSVLSSNVLGCDLQLILVIDQAASSVGDEQKAWLGQLQQQHLNKVRIRFHEQNMGASAARNTALQESLAEYNIFWDDDITPAPQCLAAYVQAMQQHPQAQGFVGPSYVAKDPDRIWACAVHQADVLFFWDAAEDWKLAEVVPWAVTANVCLVNTAEVFDLRFPKTGGGEDIDYCLKVTGGKLVPVPQAAVHHPLWNSGKRCYDRFFGWAYGDGALMAMYPQLCYFSWPNSAEALCTLLLLALTAAAAAVALAASGISVTAGWQSVQFMLLQYCFMALRCSVTAVAAAVGYKAVDLLLDVVRAFHPIRVAKHPCNSFTIRLAAAAEASLVKSWSEVGRLWGLVCRQELLTAAVPLLQHTAKFPFQTIADQVGLFKRFEFCGLSPGISAAEQARGFWRFLACCAGSWAAVTVAAESEMSWGSRNANGVTVHVVTGSAAVVLGCCFMLWRLES